ncbi:transcriptional regulator, ArsR family [Paenibacillus curdlanolyticus YK9]|uniref:Transcriptional regulator, ArsR family n=1 Tax=Paenibacillus curdlanolyticus YK9 TaxID=717606 RepID=E0I5M6_9BACL|nr:metalloregulator ArsR/SmtB family transcription factor [Paenibacillus curdlanolyticus]EFM12268.1 transcriptional regulator, ArsR family [Paenibacillus curdlanolyticus YK9]
MEYTRPIRACKDDLYRQFARIGKCLSSDKRLELLHLLSQGPKSVEKLAQNTEMSVANVSRHLQVLLDANLVRFSKKGTYVFYSLATPDIEGFLTSLWRISEMQLGDVMRIKSEFMSASADTHTLSLRDVLSKMEAGSIILLDVRPTDEYEAAHIPGAISVPLEDLDRYLRNLPKDVEIAAYCRGPYCVSSAEAVAVMQQQGYTAFRMEEGVVEWREYQSHN